MPAFGRCRRPQVRAPPADGTVMRGRRAWQVAALGALAAFVGFSAAAPAADARATPPKRTCTRPADVVDLTEWAVTLPAAGAPVAVAQPQLARYSSAAFFTARGCTVLLQAPVDAATTPNSKYPRSELREMTDGGRRKAAWSSSVGRHELDVDLAFTRLPAGKPHVVGAQVHDGSDDVTTLRLEGSKLWISDGDHSHGRLVTNDYRLGARIKLRFVV